ncbi:MAG: HlyC/CorC family transporter [Treponema sp.]|nr:HlyC/CorC family transporter [Treponema sp.]
MTLDFFDIITFVVIVLLIFFVGFFTSSETAYISLSKIKLRRIQEEGKKKARVVTKLHDNMPRLLTTVLIGTNFLNALISALATALVVKLFGGGGVGLPTLLTAFIITTFGQIIPKTIAGRFPEKKCLSSAVPLFALEKLFFPVVFLFERLSHGAVWLVEKIIKPREHLITEEELKTLIDVGEKEGTIEKNESRMLNKIIKFNDLEATDIMKHRSFVSMVSATATYDEVVQEFLESGFSTLTVYKGETENVVGIINYKKVLYGNENTDPGEGYAGRMMDDVLFVPGTFSALELLQKLREDENRFAVVLNEQGQTAGIITIEDIIRVVFGRMTDENSYDNIPAEEKIKLVNANTFVVPGDLKLDEVNSILHLNLKSEEMNTLGGWVLEQFGYLPTAGMVVVKNKVLFTVEDISQRRITSVRIRI